MDSNSSRSRLQHQKQQEQTAEQLSTSQQQTHREFATVEDVLRCDASQTPLPPAIANRLQVSLEAGPPPKRSWWQRLFQ